MSTIARVVRALSLLALALGFAAPASALSFRIDSIDVVSHTDRSNGLAVRAGGALDAQTTALGAGDSIVLDGFHVWTSEFMVLPGDEVLRDIVATFAIEFPEYGVIRSGSITGKTWGESVWLGDDVGHVVWDGPLLLEAPDLMVLQISLGDGTFHTPGMLQVDVTVSDLGGGPPGGGGGSPPGPSVPEPAAAMLFATGGWLVVRSTRQRAAI